MLRTKEATMSTYVKEWKEADSIADLVEVVLNICSLDHIIRNYGFGGIVLLRVCHDVR